MVVLVPDRADGLAAMEQNLTAANLDRWVAALHTADVDLALPRFRAAPSVSMSLGETLAAMGMPRAFRPGEADFAGMLDGPYPRLFISRVFHRARVEVDERGTVASAASAVVVNIEGAPAAARHVALRVDRPFVFLVRDRASGMVLFMGRVADPAA
jgi:serpin B